MTKLFFVLILSVLSFNSSLFSKSLWDNGVNHYKMNIKSGDIIKIKFSEKTIMKYKIEQKMDTYENTKGIKGSGDSFSFFPEMEVIENDTRKNQNNITVNSENKFNIPAKVISIENNTITLKGFHSSIMDREMFRVEISGECAMNSLTSDLSVFSTDIYNLEFKISSSVPTNTLFFSEKDLVFKTNYSDFFTNQVISTNSNGITLTNTRIDTNLSALKIEFKGLSEIKKQEILQNYLNSMINALFRN